jgi:hypothetical protein
MLSSPRRRRRLAWLGAAAAVVGGIAAVAVLVPNHTAPSTPAVTTNAAKVPTVHQATTHPVRLTRADRRGIDATLDKFIPAAVGKSSGATAWRLAGPELKAASTREQWIHGKTPVPYYPVAGKIFHGWNTTYVSKNSVEFDLLVEPRIHSHYGSWVFAGEMVRRHSHWLVNRLYPTAMMRPVRGNQHEIGTADFGAPAASGPTTTGHGRLSGIWLLAILGAIVLGLLFPIGFGLTSLIRNRHRRTGTNRALPPLPQKR